jgi:hypothetical protein
MTGMGMTAAAMVSSVGVVWGSGRLKKNRSVEGVLCAAWGEKV